MHPRQLRFAWRYINLLLFGRQTVLHALRKHAHERPNQPFLFFDGQWQTWGAFWHQVQKRANALQQLGAKPNEVTALWMENSPAMLQNVLAVCQLGGVAALIAPGLQREALVHNLLVSEAKRLVIDPSLVKVVVGNAQAFSAVPLTILWDEAPPASALKGKAKATLASWSVLSELAARQPSQASFAKVPRAGRLALLIHTSGTTGLPKAARITHQRWMGAGLAMGFYAMHLTPRDCLYCPLPLHHSNGILIAFGSALVNGSRFALSQRFSASHFWQEVAASKASAFVYIGELLRYLSQAKPQAAQRQHAIRVVLGNGLRPDLWRVVQQRFGIPIIREFYASTEGNSILVNMTNREGSVGKPLLAVFDNTALVQPSATEGEIVRNSQGFCQLSAPNQAGELLGKIRFTTPFHGYTQSQKAKDKVLHHVFKHGDAFFRSGDLMRRDESGDFFFIDRLGDTFRWKGENVSTQQVEQVLHQLPALAFANVYGVEVPGAEGRAGMAAVMLQPNTTFDGEGWFAFLKAHLPAYAVPVFVRCVQQLATTATMKLPKKDLKAQGIDLTLTKGDAVFYANWQAAAYQPWTLEHHQQCSAGKLRL